jgi:rhodanese-related sulfurtransferase
VLPGVTNHDLQKIVFCSEGYTSSLAAAAQQELALWRATEIVGGIKAWREQTSTDVRARNTIPKPILSLYKAA